jgi:tetratricopeptide (TPR) repeat protein
MTRNIDERNRRAGRMCWMAAAVLVGLLSVAAGGRAESVAAAPSAKDATPGASPVNVARTIEDFTKAVKESAEFDAALKQEVLHALTEDAKDPASQGEMLATALGRLYPEFGKGLTALGDEDVAAAVAAFKPLVGASDPYLAAHASFYLARAFVAQEEYELALALLQDVREKYPTRTLNSGDALFLQGVCLRKTLKRKEAMEAFGKFIKEYPDAPERLQMGAVQQLYDLAQIKDGTLDDVTDIMGFVQQRLEREKTDKQVTIPNEKKIIDTLDKLIKEAEDKEKQSNSSSSDSKRGKGGQTTRKGGKPDSPANQSITRPGEVPDTTLPKLRGGDPNWVKEKEKEREKVLEAVKGKMSERDRDLIERYFKNLMESRNTPPAADEEPGK